MRPASGATAAQTAAGLGANLWFLKFSRDDEAEAIKARLLKMSSPRAMPRR